jgi:hypothetical protein
MDQKMNLARDDLNYIGCNIGGTPTSQIHHYGSAFPGCRAADIAGLAAGSSVAFDPNETLKRNADCRPFVVLPL